jgi:hypothetical protein
MHLFFLANQEVAEEKRQMQKRGGFGISCSNSSLSGTILSSTCKDYNGVTHQTTIDLNNRITNNNGQLQLD